MLLVKERKYGTKTKKSLLMVTVRGPWVNAFEVLDYGYIFMTLCFKAKFLWVILMQFSSISVFLLLYSYTCKNLRKFC